MGGPTRDDDDDEARAIARARRVADDVPGQLGRDDRGNITWQWKQDEGLLADDTAGAAARVQALLDPNLDIQEDEPTEQDPRNITGLMKGYDPYQSGVLGTKERKKKRDLHALSRWVEARKKFGGKPPT